MVYCDYNADTPIDPRVLEVLKNTYDSFLGNPSSIHHFGRTSRHLLNEARRKIASYFKVQSQEVIFTSGATEAINTVIQGFKGKIITSSLEHSAVLNAAKKSKNPVVLLEPKPGYGAIDIDQLKELELNQPTMVVLASVNNETGIKTEIESIGQWALETKSLFFVDATAQMGKESVELHPGVSGLCFSGHKIYGPQGVGVMILKKPFHLHPLIVGGGQEYEFRSGTPATPEICALAKAVELCQTPVTSMMRDLFEKELEQRCDVQIHGKDQNRVSNTSFVAFKQCDAEHLMMHLDQQQIAVSLGSACSAGVVGLSHVLLHMGVDPQLVKNSIRFSFGRFTTEQQVLQVVKAIETYSSCLRK